LNPAGETPDKSNSTLVEFRLSAVDGATILRVVESGFNELGWSEKTASSTVDGHIAGWGVHTDALIRYFASDRQLSVRL